MFTEEIMRQLATQIGHSLARLWLKEQAEAKAAQRQGEELSRLESSAVDSRIEVKLNGEGLPPVKSTGG